MSRAGQQPMEFPPWQRGPGTGGPCPPQVDEWLRAELKRIRDEVHGGDGERERAAG